MKSWTQFGFQEPVPGRMPLKQTVVEICREAPSGTVLKINISFKNLSPHLHRSVCDKSEKIEFL